jgi:heterodisulfide reductase subunit D
MNGRNAAGSNVKVFDVVELMAQAMGLDMTIPENPYTKNQGQDVIASPAPKKAMATVEAQ